MTVQVSREELKDAVGILEKICARQVTLPILQCVVLQAKGERLGVRATNLDIGISREIPATIENEGEVAVPAAILSQVLATLQGTTLTLTFEKNTLTIEGDQGTTKLNCFDPQEFPTLPQVEKGVTLTLPAEKLLQAIKAVYYSASQSTIKPELASIYLYTKGSDLVAVATDSFRLSEKRVALKQAVQIEGLLFPIRSVVDLVRPLEGVSGDIAIAYNENQISFSFATTYITSRLIDGSFPDYQQIIPKDHSTEAVLLKQDILQTLRKAGIFSDKFNQVTFHMEPKKKKFIIEANNTEVGEMKEQVSTALQGNDLTIRFNQRYVLDCFQSIQADSVSFHFSGVGKPVIIRGISDPTFLYLVMPMNT